MSLQTELLNFQNFFEENYKVKCVIYGNKSSAGASDKEEKSSQSKNASYRGGLGYAGDPTKDVENLQIMHQLHEEMISKDNKLVEQLSSIRKLLQTALTAKPQITADLICNSSCISFVVGFLIRQSPLLEMSKRSLLFQELFQMIQELSGNSATKVAFGKNAGNNIVLFRELNTQVQLYLKFDSASKEDDFEHADMTKFVQDLQKTLEEVLKNLSDVDKGDEKYESNAQEKKESSNVTEEEQVRQWMISQQFKIVDISGESFTYGNELKSTQPQKKKLMKLKQDMTILSNSLPEGIFVRIDENRYDKMKVMIIGPQGTPYENGTFFFDLYLPDAYPDCCPKMLYLTTGHGQFYFNPNLYTEGKVCLSLLGTWSGPGWDPRTSTILQLLVSLQAMVLVDHPYENEPGYEGTIGTYEDMSYEFGIRHATMEYAILWALQHESSIPQCFVDVVDAHFYRLKLNGKLTQQLDAWKGINQDCLKQHGDSMECNYFAWRHLFNNDSFEKYRTSIDDLMGKLSKPNLN